MNAHIDVDAESVLVHSLVDAGAKVEHPFHVIKRQFYYTKVRFCGLAKNIGQQATLFALSNFCIMRKWLLAMGEVRL